MLELSYKQVPVTTHTQFLVLLFVEEAAAAALFG